MALRDLVAEVRTAARDRGKCAAVREGMQKVSLGGLRKLGRAGFRRGTPVYEREWDLLVVLDGCRADVLREVAHEYDYLEEVDEHTSPASMSETWLERTFSDGYTAEMQETVVVTGNPYSATYLNADAFLDLDEVWRYEWDEEGGTIHPRPLTDRAIEAWRGKRPAWLVVHYMQPHYPFVPDPISDGIDLSSFGENEEPSAWRLLKRGKVNRARIWEAYRENLRYVLDDVAVLLDSVDAGTAIITADHGNAFGEWGVYGHPKEVPLSVLRRVPWVVTESTDTGRYQPSTPRTEREETEVSERLKALGYRS